MLHNLAFYTRPCHNFLILASLSNKITFHKSRITRHGPSIGLVTTSYALHMEHAQNNLLSLLHKLYLTFHMKDRLTFQPIINSDLCLLELDLERFQDYDSFLYMSL